MDKETKSLQISLAQSTLKGPRELNEDYYACLTPQNTHLFRRKGVAAVIADGVGDNGAGQEASHHAVTGFFSDYYSTPETWSVQRSAEQVLRSLNGWLYSKGQQTYKKGYITTFSAVILNGRWLHLIHVGDSRVYLSRKGNLECLSRDHCTLENSDQLTRALGLDTDIIIDYRNLPLEVGDQIVLATDGVYKYVKEQTVKTLLNENITLQEKADGLTSLASKGKSHDNMTCQILKVNNLPSPTYSDLIDGTSGLIFPPVLSKGVIVDDYELQDITGEGAMGFVYTALDKKTGKLIALKCPKEELSQTPLLLERLHREEWVGLKVNSPNLMKAFVPRQIRSKYYYLILEYCPGDSLREKLDHSGPFTLEETVDIAKQLCRGMVHLHRLDIFHRDIKPDSVLVSNEGEVKIIDYGIAKITNTKALSLKELEGEFLGSPCYQAPEIFKWNRGSVQTDIFSLGVTLYEMLTEKYPYGEVLDHKSHKFGEYIPASDYNSNIPGWMEIILKKCLQKDPYKRYSSTSEILYDLDHPETILSEKKFIPLIERNPLTFWKRFSILSLVLNLLLIIFLISYL